MADASQWIVVKFSKPLYMFYAPAANGSRCLKKYMVAPAPSMLISSVWERAGFFLALWRASLAEYDEMEGIAWLWQSIDGASVKAPLAQESVGPNPTDREKKWKQTAFVSRRAWRPAVTHRNRGEPP